MTKILALIPHADDEIVGPGIALYRRQQKGDSILLADLTHGCPPEDSLWPWQRGKAYRNRVATRAKEATNVAKAMNAARFPIGHIPARQVRFHLHDLFNHLQHLITEQKIDEVWAPAYEGGNADHDAANALAFALQQSNTGLKVFEFAEYHAAKGTIESQSFPHKNGEEEIVTLTGAEQALKKQWLALYVSEQKNLFYVKTEQEMIRPLARYDYTRPPHDGRLGYERFHWVPFRHPRIDWAKGAENSATITAFLQECVRARNLPAAAR
jgi:N-acetylglucosamine malate deacetylase 1